MNFEEQKQPETLSTNCLINDENNNFQNSSCTNCEYTNNKHFNEKPDISTDDEYFCSSCSSDNDSELISLNTKTLWHDISHLIKCIYRETNREFSENHSTNDLYKAKEYVQILTQSNPEIFFNKIELIVLDYVDEIRNQVLKRSQTYLKSSNDVQLFISYLLDEYNTFIQAAKNVSTIVSYLEEHYMKSFHLTWLLYNKHLYEKLVYTDKKIQHSMSIMIDLLQPSNDNTNDYSPAEYTQLLNRFLAFDEEMSEIACLYKDCQTNMLSISRNTLTNNRNSIGIIVKKTKKNICKKTKRFAQDNFNSSTTNAVNIPLSSSSSINSTIIPTVSQQDSNGSSIGSGGIEGKESSSISSFDEYSLGNHTPASSYTKEELYPEIENTNSTSTFETTEKEQTTNISSIKKSKSNRRKDNSNPTKPSSIKHDLILPPKLPTKLQADFRPLTMPSCSSVLSAKIQSVSFTAGTFGSITTNESPINRSHLNLNLSRKQDSTIALNNFDQLLRQAASPNEISAFLSTLESNRSIDELQKDKNCDFCCCDLFSESNSSSSPLSNHCVACMSLPANATTITCAAFNQRDVEVKERLKLKLTKRTVQNLSDTSTKLSTGNKLKTKPCNDNNIDDLVRFIDGDETISTEIIPKKPKKKKDKQQNKSTPKTDPPQTTSSSKQKKKTKLKTEEEEEEELIDQSSTLKPPIPPIKTSFPEKNDSKSIKIELSSENPLTPEEEINWITISRKQSKHKSASVPIIPSNNSKQKQITNKKKSSNNQTIAQQKVISETVINSNKLSTTTTKPLQNTIKTTPNIQQKIETSSAWSNHEQVPTIPVASTSNLLATAPVFIPSSSLLTSNQTNNNNLFPLEQPSPSPAPPSSSSSLYWDPNGYLLPPGPVPRPSTSTFSPAPGQRCIRRPSPESTTSYTSTWNDTSEKNSNESQWKYSYDEQIQTSTIPNDFPLYDPFNSGASLTIPSSSSSLLTNHISQNNDIDEMDALDKEIQDFKKCYIDNIPFDSHDKLQGNIDHRFIHQS